MNEYLSGLPGKSYTDKKELLEKIYSAHGVQLTAEAPDEWDEILDKLIQRIWKNKALPEKLDAELLKRFAEEFTKALFEGLGNFAETKDETDKLFIEKLVDDVWQFSGAKTYQQMKDITGVLVDATGQLRSYRDFKFEAGKINEEYVGPWLKAEYNNAVAGAQMGAKWQQIQKDKEALPYLQYLTVNDERVREDHQELEGIVRKVDDDFWKYYFPPNGWNCRCDVKQLSYVKKETDLSKVPMPDVPPMFRFNPGIEGMVFPKGHPYYDGMPDEYKKQITSNQQQATSETE